MFKKIMLINPKNPSFLKSKDKSIPMGLLYLGAYIKKNNKCKVKLFDLSIKEYDLIKEINKFKPELIGISCLFSGRFNGLLEISKKIKKIFNIPIIIGGLHPTMYAKEILANEKSIDFVCLGEGEITFSKIIKGIELDKIEGVGYRDKGKIIINKKINYIEDLDSIPFPDYDLINLEDYYFDTSKWYNPKKLSIKVPIPIITSRSCPNRCTFCSMFLVHGRKWRTRSYMNVVDEIEMMVNKGMDYFSFMDDNFTLSKERTMNICKEIIKRKLNIQFDTPNGVSIKTLDKEVMNLLVKAGLIRLCVAPEHGSEYIRNELMKKNITDKQIYNFFNMMRNFKQVKIKAFFIIGYPEETRESLQELKDMIIKIKDRLDYIAIFNLVPFPKTEIYEKCVSYKLIKKRDNLYCKNNYANYNDSDITMIKPFKLEIEELKTFREEMYNLFNRNI